MQAQEPEQRLLQGAGGRETEVGSIGMEGTIFLRPLSSGLRKGG
jgi:hypothetical protein